MKKNKIINLLLIPIVVIGITFSVQAKGFSSRSSGHSSFHSSSHRSSRPSSFKGNSIKIKSPNGVRAGKLRVNKPKRTNKNVNINKSKNVNVNKNINRTIIHKHYNAPRYNMNYNTPYGNTFRSSFWDNYWMYRTLTHHNTVVINGATGVPQTINYGYSGIWKDILTLSILILIIVFVVKKIKSRN